MIHKQPKWDKAVYRIPDKVIQLSTWKYHQMIRRAMTAGEMLDEYDRRRRQSVKRLCKHADELHWGKPDDD